MPPDLNKLQEAFLLIYTAITCLSCCLNVAHPLSSGRSSREIRLTIPPFTLTCHTFCAELAAITRLYKTILLLYLFFSVFFLYKGRIQNGACVRLCTKYQSLVVGVVVGALRKVAPTPKEYQALRVVRKETFSHTRFLPSRRCVVRWPF